MRESFKINSSVKYYNHLIQMKKQTFSVHSHSKGVSSFAKTQHLFILRGSQKSYFKGNVEVDFSPVRIPNPSFSIENQHKTTSSTRNPLFQEYKIVPEFNTDGRYYTSTFIHNYDGDNEAQMFNYTKQKMKESQKDISEKNILIPKPKSKHKYCAVCKDVYEDYLDHIDSYSHSKKIKKSIVNRQISNLQKILLKIDAKFYPRNGIATRRMRKNSIKLMENVNVRSEKMISIESSSQIDVDALSEDENQKYENSCSSQKIILRNKIIRKKVRITHNYEPRNVMKQRDTTGKQCIVISDQSL